MSVSVEINERIRVGDDAPLLLIAGPCVIEGQQLCVDVAGQLAELCAGLGINYVFKSSFDKANRTSLSSFRGPGIDDGLAVLGAVRERLDVAVTTDVHEVAQVEPTAAVVDLLQIPAFLCRQTDLLLAAGRSGAAVNVKKGQFLRPEAMGPVLEKLHSTGNPRVMLCERGSSHGYGGLVVDMRALPIMRALGVPVLFDATHSVQHPEANGTGGRRELAPLLMRSAAAAGIDGVFLETHPDPDRALSDGVNSIRLSDLPWILEQTLAVHELSRRQRSYDAEPPPAALTASP